MRPKTLAILLIAFICVVAGVVFVIKQKTSMREEKSLGMHLFSQLPVDRIWEIDIKGKENRVSLIRKEGIWVVKEHFGYVADFSQISQLIEKLKETNTGQCFEANKETIRRLMLVDPDDPKAKEDEKGTALIFKDKEGKIIKKIIFGKAMRQGGKESFPIGQYIRFSNEKNVYLINQYIESLSQTPAEWIRLNITDVNPRDIKEIRGYKGEKNPVYVILREKEGEELKLKKSLKKIDKNIIKRLGNALSYLRIEDVVDPLKNTDSFGISKNLYVEYRLFNGMIYRIYPSKRCDNDNCYMRISFSYNGDNEALIKKAENMNKIFAPWIYKISKWRHESFFLP